MTQKEKAEAYDKALERARAINNGKDVDVESGTTTCEYIFPELKEENNDERIKKNCIHFLELQKQHHAATFAIEECITWLEKQGKEECALKSFKDKDVHKFMEYIEKEAKAYDFNLPNRGYDIYAFAKDLLIWLEKQCEQTNERAWLYLVSDVLTWKDGIGQYLDDPRVQELAKRLCSEYAQKLYRIEKKL